MWKVNFVRGTKKSNKFDLGYVITFLLCVNTLLQKHVKTVQQWIRDLLRECFLEMPTSNGHSQFR